jgi:hypothetical protein
MSLDLTVRTNPIPEGFCFTGFGPGGNWLDLIALLYVRFPSDLTLFNFGSTTPSADKRDRPWIRTNSDGTPDQLYVYAMGSWLAKHQMPTGIVCMYDGTEASIDTFDGGEAGAVTSISGPFWEKVSDMDGRFPVGPGELTPSTTVLAVGDTGGEDEHVLTSAEMPEHVHVVPGSVTPQGNGDFDVTGGTGGSPAVYPGTSNSEPTGDDDPHNNLPPYRAIWFIRRSSRIYRRI